MSDFLYSTTQTETGALRAALRPWVLPLGIEPEERHGPWGSLALALPEHERHAVHEDDGALSVVVGHPAVSAPDRLPALIGRADNRARVHDALTDPLACVQRLDGHFAALRIEKPAGAGWGQPRAPRGAVATDRFGFVDLYQAAGRSGGLVLGTHPEAVADATGRADDIDVISVADACANFVSTFPWTLYEGVEQVEPGAVREFDADGWASPPDVYWRPWEAGSGPVPGPSPGRTELADRLREALLESVEVATTGADRAALLLSGGEDSRTVLAAVPERVDVCGVVYAEWESREVRIARRVGRAHGARVERSTREPDHYSDHFPRMARLAGSTHLFTDMHGYGLDIEPPLASFPVVLGGLSADSLLKALYAPRRSGRYETPRLSGLRPDVLEAVDERRNRYLDWARQWRPETADEWMWLWPFSMRKYSGNLAGSRRSFTNWQPYHSTEILDIAAIAPQAMKRRRRLFRTAMRPLLRRTAWIPHAKRHFPYLGPVANALAIPVLEAARAIRALATRELGVSHRAWPGWSTVATSEGMRRWEHELPLVDTPIGEIFESREPDAVDAARREWTSLSRMKLAELAYLRAVHREG